MRVYHGAVVRLACLATLAAVSLPAAPASAGLAERAEVEESGLMVQDQAGMVGPEAPDGESLVSDQRDHLPGSPASAVTSEIEPPAESVGEEPVTPNVAVSASRPRVAAGGVTSVRITAANVSDATTFTGDLTITLQPPSGMELRPADDSGCTGTPAGITCQKTGVTLTPAGEPAVWDIPVATSADLIPGPYQSQARLETTPADAVADDNTTPLIIDVTPPDEPRTEFDLEAALWPRSLATTRNRPLAPGVATITNKGPGVASDVALTLTLPTGVTVDSDSANCLRPEQGQTWVCRVPNALQPPGQADTVFRLSFTLRAGAAAASGPVRLTVSSPGDINAGNNVREVLLTVEGSPVPTPPPTPSPSPSSGVRNATVTPSVSTTTSPAPARPTLAKTGAGSTVGIGVAGGALLLTGGALLGALTVGTRRRKGAGAVGATDAPTC